MAPRGSELVRKALTTYRARRREYATLAFVAVMIMVSVALGLHQRGIAATYTEMVLDCHYAGSGAHTHDESCYDADGNLVCPLQEREYHVHDDSCYTETRTLVCGLEESEGHTHTDACYDEEGNLVCGLEESEGHTHTDACYEVTRELTCGKEEVTEVHTHGPGCFKTITVNDGADNATDNNNASDETVQAAEADEKMPAQAFEHEFKDADDNLVLRVDVAAEEGQLPAGTTMTAEWVDPAKFTEGEQKAVDKAIATKTEGIALKRQVVRISFTDAYGAEVEPKSAVSVTLTTDLAVKDDAPVVVNLQRTSEMKLDEDEKKDVERLEKIVPAAKAIDALSDKELDKRNMTLATDQLAFDARDGAYATYVLATTSQDLQMRSEGETVTVTVDAPASAGVPRGSSLKVVEIAQGTDDYQAYEDQALEAMGAESAQLARFFDITIVDADGQEVQPVKPVAVKIKLTDAPSDEQSSVVHFDEDGANVTPEVIPADVNKHTTKFEAESFSVYGVVYTVVIGPEDDGVYRFEGEDYTITITCPEEAHIPVGTELTVSELEPGTDEYLQRLGQLWTEKNKKYLEVKEMRENYSESMGELPDVPLVNLDHVRFFDISLVFEEGEIEPDVPVQVEIAYADGMQMAGEVVSGVVHYTKSDVELIEGVETVTEGDAVVAFRYEQGSFSDTGTYVGQNLYVEKSEVNTLPAPTPMEYPLLQTKATKAAGVDAGDDADVEGATKAEGEQLSKPKATKTLTPNKAEGIDDGTYTLELAVDGSPKTSTTTEINKANVLIVMDRSSSMVDNNPTLNVTQVNTSNNWIPTSSVQYYGRLNDNGKIKYFPLTYTISGSQYSWWMINTDDPNTGLIQYRGDIYTGVAKTRLQEEQEALSEIIYSLLQINGEGETDDGISLEDVVEVSVISFAKDRNDQNDGNPHPSSEQDWTTDYDDLMEAVRDEYAPSGTNWEQALKYAMSMINSKKQDETQAGEDYYIMFLTDGEPTATSEHHSSAYYYDGGGNGGFINAYNAARNYVVNSSGIAAADDVHFYGVMTWGTNDTMRTYLKRIVNVANGNVDNELDLTTEAVDGDGVDDYYYDATDKEELKRIFSHILNLISNSLAYQQVSITDGLTTDAMTSTIVSGSTEGYTYTVYRGRVVDENGNITNPGTPVYTVTASDGEEGQEPTVTFTVGNQTKQGTKESYAYNELQADGTTNPVTKDYYAATFGEGDDAVTYKMTLADRTDAGKLTWDLAALGTLEDGYTYAVSFTVWPDQDAYDYVAALNNGIEKITNSKNEQVDVAWNTNFENDEHKVTDSNGKSYWTGGVSAYPSIVKYTDGTFAVLTNTDQSFKYTIVNTKVEDGTPTVTYDGPYTSDLPTPNPMPLDKTASRLQKVWNIDRDASILYHYLYELTDDQDNPKAFDIDFTIKEDGEDYRHVHLPGADVEVTTDGVTYDWSKYKQDQGLTDSDMATYEGATFAKRWVQDFSISTGLMLSTSRMLAVGLLEEVSEGVYRSTSSRNYDTFEKDGTTYYVLEDGHDFTISEPDMYEFDFKAPTFHPMLVDGVLYNVEYVTEGGNRRIDKMTAIPVDAETGVSTLQMENTLRGYLHVDKDVIDHNNDPLPSDKTRFSYEVELTNDDPVFKGANIPWYGISGLYYHDAEGKYYQAEVRGGQLWLTMESGETYKAQCAGFDPDKVGDQTIFYAVDGENYTDSVTINGNQMTPDASTGNATDGYCKVTATLTITQDETLNIANIPVNTTYKVTEVSRSDYQLTSITRKVGENGTYAEGGSTETGVIEGVIEQNTETYVLYTNKCLITDMNVKKIDEEDKGLPGAVFQLKVHDESVGGSWVLATTTIDSVGGLSTVEMTVNGETRSWPSAFETTGEVQTITGLPDGRYRLYEVHVPDGHISTFEYIEFKIENRDMSMVTESDKLKFDAASGNSLALLTVTNEAGTELPAAGGMGTTVLTALGTTLLVVGALLLLLRRSGLSTR